MQFSKEIVLAIEYCFNVIDFDQAMRFYFQTLFINIFFINDASKYSDVVTFETFEICYNLSNDLRAFL